MNYKLLTESIIDPTTGEISTRDFKEIISKSQLKGGFRMVYDAYDEMQLEVVNSKKDMLIMIHIKKMFTRTKVEIPLNAREIAKDVSKKLPKGSKPITFSKISVIIKRMVECDFLFKPKRGLYRMNPFAYLPVFSNGTLLQKEWRELKDDK